MNYIVKKQKLTLLIFALLICMNLKSQWQQYTPYNPTSVTFNGTYSSGIINDYGYNATLNTIKVSGTAKYDVKANKTIKILPGSYAKNLNSTGSFRAHIEAPALEVVSYHTNGFNNIPRYDKFELGIKLPDDLTQRVNAFFGYYKIGGGFGYGCEFKQGPAYPNNINPYDPDQISVEATFSFPDKPSQTIYGFYYREYTYSGNYSANNPPNFTNMDWVENTNLQYHWRVRFAPKYLGTYKVTWKIKTNNGNTIVYEDNIGQNFTTSPPSNPGFLKIGDQGKFLVTQPDPSGPQTTLLPIGLVDNAGTPGPNTGDGIPPYDINPSEDYDLQFPSRYWKHRYQIQNRIAKKHGNFVRIFSEEWNYEIERETKGIYDARPGRPMEPGLSYTDTSIEWPVGTLAPLTYKGTNRQAILWEMDSIFDMAKNNGLYIQWVLSPHWEYGMTVHNSFPPVVSDLTFFTDPSLRKSYKNRLRYFIARYGYSTNLAVIELYNEVQHLNDSTNLGPNGPNNVFLPWLEEMLEYIKGVSNLNHTDHLCTVSYELGHGGDAIGFSPKLDFMSSHPYNYYKSHGFDYSYSSAQEFKLMGYNKPYQAGELGIAPEGVVPSMYPEFMGPTFHTLLWSTTFMGGITSGLDMWGNRGLDTEPTTPDWPHDCAGNFVEHFMPLKNFISNYNFDQGNYVAKNYSTNQIETYYLKDNGGFPSNNAIGYVRNKSFWFSNLGLDSAEINEYNNVNWTQANNNQQIPLNQPVNNGFLGPIMIEGLNPYSNFIIEWYDTYNGALISSMPFMSNQMHTTLPPPNFGGTCFNHEYGFKIKPDYYNPRSASNSDSLEEYSNLAELSLETNPTGIVLSEEQKELGSRQKGSNSSMASSIIENKTGNIDLKVYPNPASDKIYIKYNKNQFKDCVIELFDVSNRLILKQANLNELNTSNIDNGAYWLKFSSGNYTKTFKINILH